MLTHNLRDDRKVGSRNDRPARAEIIGIVVAGLALAGLTSGIGFFLFADPRIELNSTQGAGLAIAAAALIMYLWVALAWFFARRFAVNRLKADPGFLAANYKAIVNRATLSGALLVLPAIVMWAWLVTGGNWFGLVLVSGIGGTLAVSYLVEQLQPMLYADLTPYLEEIHAEDPVEKKPE